MPTLRVIPTRVHGIIDYVTGTTLLAAPTVLRLDGGTASAMAPRAVGLGATAYSAATDYELGARRVLPMPVHLVADAASGAALAATPWLSGDAERGPKYWLPHAVVGGSEVVLAATTKTRPADERFRTRALRLLARAGVRAPGSPRAKGKVAVRGARGAVNAVRSAPVAKLAAARAAAAAPGSGATKAKALGGLLAARAAGKAPGSARAKAKTSAKVARRKRSSQRSTPERVALLGVGLAGAFARQAG